MICEQMKRPPTLVLLMVLALVFLATQLYLFYVYHDRPIVSIMNHDEFHSAFPPFEPRRCISESCYTELNYRSSHICIFQNID